MIADLAREVSGDLDSLLRRTLVALITADVHARDITETMHHAKVDSPSSFTWPSPVADVCCAMYLKKSSFLEEYLFYLKASIWYLPGYLNYSKSTNV